MKTLLVEMIVTMAMIGCVTAGHPICISEDRACATADLVVLAKIGAPRDIAREDPFADSGVWGSAFAQVAPVKVLQVLVGTQPEDVRLYGGQVPGGTAYRIMEGEYLVLLKKLKDGAYRAVDWHYSFAPIKDGRIGWLVDEDPNPTRREWLTTAAVLQRIKAFKSKSEQPGADQPATKPADKVPAKDRPSTPTSKDHSGNR